MELWANLLLPDKNATSRYVYVRTCINTHLNVRTRHAHALTLGMTVLLIRECITYVMMYFSSDASTDNNNYDNAETTNYA